MTAKTKSSITSNCWLFKSECYLISHLKAEPRRTTYWDGVRNYQARNMLRDDIHVGDRVLFYHSGDERAVVGTAIVTRAGYPDHTARERDAQHFDPKATAENPIWMMVDIRLEKVFARPVPLAELRTVRSLSGMELLRQGSRLSIQPVTPEQFDTIVELSEQAGGEDRPAARRNETKPRPKGKSKARST
ncbi:MAG: EVE domain-containing protein [Planctomycetia bacterium]|nr:EVE domain-containing protein [Planctomycetia bacterium]